MPPQRSKIFTVYMSFTLWLLIFSLHIAFVFLTLHSSGTNYGPLGMFKVSCSGSEGVLDECNFETDGICSQSELRAGVICIPSCKHHIHFHVCVYV